MKKVRINTCPILEGYGVFVMKKVHINMCPILEGYGVMGVF